MGDVGVSVSKDIELVSFIRGRIRMRLGMTWNKAVADIREWIGAPSNILQLLHDEALAVDLLKAGERPGFLTIEDLLLVHVHYVEMVASAREATRCVRPPFRLVEKPVLVAFGIGVRAQIKVEFPRLHLQGQV